MTWGVDGSYRHLVRPQQERDEQTVLIARAVFVAALVVVLVIVVLVVIDQLA